VGGRDFVLEGSEDLGQYVGGDAGAPVGDGNRDPVRSAIEGHRHVAARIAIAHGVAQEIVQG
jgi:hypothetical protein